MSRLLLLAIGLACGASSSLYADWQLVWSDEFEGATIDPTRWNFDIGTGPPDPGWGNRELEYYTRRPQNAYVANGVLHIVALKESYLGSAYTSARLTTRDRFSKKYGRFELRAQLPSGQGYWPALWLMPRDSVYGSWAASGEIDIMENRGANPTTVLGTIHFGGPYPNNTQSFGPAYSFAPGDSVTNFHLYTLEWTNNAIRWYVDGQLYQSQTSWWSSSNPSNTSVRNPYPAPFDQPFYLVMNLAVGGNFGGNPDATAVFPGEMLVDYVRIYDGIPPKPAPLISGVAVGQGQVVLSGLQGTPHTTCYLLRSIDLKGPIANWTRIGTNQFDATGSFRVTNSIPSPASFYRLQLP